MRDLYVSKSKWYRLGFRSLLCFLSFVIGCTFTLCFVSTSECTKSTVDVGASIKKSRVVNIQENDLKKTLVILILSAPDNIIKRHAQRRSWLSLIDQDAIKYYFVTGSKGLNDDTYEKLQTEAEHYSDLLILPEVQESYSLLTKKLLASFLWLNKNVDFSFSLKIDDDSFVDIRQLFRELMKITDSKRLYWGYFNGHAQVQHKGKWKEVNWNLCDHYLPYARGGGYILSKQLVQFLAQNADLLTVYKNEDVSVGAWLAPLNVTRVHDVRFDTEWSSRGCSNQHLITHPVDISKMYQLHETLVNTGRLCLNESRKRSAYIYDWDGLPSQCCNSLAP